MVHLSEEEKKKHWVLWMVLVRFELYIAAVMLRKTKKKDLVHDVFSSHNDVHLWIVYQIKKKMKKIIKKFQSVDALIVHVIRLVGLLSFSTALHIFGGRAFWTKREKTWLKQTNKKKRL